MNEHLHVHHAPEQPSASEKRVAEALRLGIIGFVAVMTLMLLLGAVVPEAHMEPGKIELMRAGALAVCAFVAIQHVGFLVIEMFLWNRPFGRKLFQLTPELAEQSAPLAMNQGLYNGFLAAGLVWGLADGPNAATLTFFLACVIVAGLFGGATAKASIALVQGLPAAIALLLLRLS